MVHRTEAEGVEDLGNVALPKLRQFRVSLEGMLNRKDKSFRYRRLLQTLRPPMLEYRVDVHIEPLFGRRSLCKGIASVDTKHLKIFLCADGIEKAQPHFVNAQGIGMAQDMDCLAPGGTVTYAASLFCSIHFHSICPDPVENRGILWGATRHAKHTLRLVLVELLPLTTLSFRPVLLHMQEPAHKPGHISNTISDPVSNAIFFQVLAVGLDALDRPQMMTNIVPRLARQAEIMLNQCKAASEFIKLIMVYQGYTRR